MRDQIIDSLSSFQFRAVLRESIIETNNTSAIVVDGTHLLALANLVLDGKAPSFTSASKRGVQVKNDATLFMNRIDAKDFPVGVTRFQGAGLYVSGRSSVFANKGLFTYNGGTGIEVQNRSIVEAKSSTANRNQRGFAAIGDSTLYNSGSRAVHNWSDGFAAAGHSLIVSTTSVAISNLASGFSAIDSVLCVPGDDTLFADKTPPTIGQITGGTLSFDNDNGFAGESSVFIINDTVAGGNEQDFPAVSGPGNVIRDLGRRASIPIGF